jgi:hypothetical protein
MDKAMVVKNLGYCSRTYFLDPKTGEVFYHDHRTNTIVKPPNDPKTGKPQIVMESCGPADREVTHEMMVFEGYGADIILYVYFNKEGKVEHYCVAGT